jgi:hypothetical protein
VILPLAHLGHWLWTLYLIPVLIVVGAIFKSKRAERRRDE